MELAVIDWKNLNSRFVRDDVYEHINAPQWFDFSASEDAIDDESWFCRPDCNHPKTVEDFYRQTPPNSKKSSGLSEGLPVAELTRRDSALKKRGLSYAPIFPIGPKSGAGMEHSEIQNPNFSTPLNHKSKSFKDAVKSSAEKKPFDEKTMRKETPRSLKSTLSTRNLFTSGDLLSKVKEFCTEWKKLAMRAKVREHAEVCVSDSSSDESGKFSVKVTERKPLLEANLEKCTVRQTSNTQQKPGRKARYEDENAALKVDAKNIKQCEEENLPPIQTCPPTPQCISATQGPSRASPLKAINRRMPERRPFQDSGFIKLNVKKDQDGGRRNQGGQASLTPEKEA